MTADPRPAPATLRVPVGGGRVLAVDDVGDPAGTPVLYLHGTPDSRLARHPDDGLAAATGVRLLAADRPGYGGSDPLPPGTEPSALAGDVAALLDALGVGRCAVLAWSGGAPAGLVVAAELGARVTGLGIAAGMVPGQAFDDPAVRDAAPGRLAMVELAGELPPGELGDMMAPMLAPYPCDRDLAAEHQRAQRDDLAAAEVAAVAGASERLADALVEGVRSGLAGVAADVEAHYRPLAVDPAAVRCPVRLWWGAGDAVTPPAFGAWYAARIPGAELEVVPGAGHYLALTRWKDLLAALAALASE